MKYVLCIPEGGLNDMLCQISRCNNYCIDNGRTLLIDTNNNSTFKDDFSFYFKSKSDMLKLNYNEIIDILYVLKSCNAKCYPDIDYINIKSYYCDKNVCFVSNENNLPITFDFSNWYHETLLIYNNCGGGIPHNNIYNDICLTNNIKNIFNERLIKIYEKINSVEDESVNELIIKSYTAVHIRNTDMKCSNINKFINSLSEIYNIFFVSTDCKKSLDIINSKYNIIHFSNIENTDISLHRDIIDNNLKRIRNIDSIIDLLLLSFSNILIGSTDCSGYYILANYLKNNTNLRDLLFDE